MMTAKTIVVFRRELRDAFRDRSTIFSVLVLPLVVYPLMFIGMGVLIGSQQRGEEQRLSRVIVVGNERESALTAALAADPKIAVAELPEPDSALQRGTIQAMVRLGRLAGGRILAVVSYDQASRSSEVAKGRVQKALAAHGQRLVAERLRDNNIDTLLLTPVAAEYRNIASARRMGGFVMGMIIPHMIVLLICVGAMHTAMDTTAGEKERRTIETLLVSSANRNQIVAGKLLATIVMGLITGLMGLLSLGVTMLSGVSIFTSRQAGVNLSLSPGAMAASFLTVIPTAVLIAALLLLIGSYSRSVKEGTSYASYFLMAIIMVSMGSMTPMEPSPRMFLIPVLNTALCQKELLLGAIDWGHLGASLVTTGMAALAAVGVTVALFSQERVLFRS